MPKILHVIAAVAENRVIGRGGKLPWRIPEDQAFFDAETAGQICVLGRICFETWPGATQKGRRPIVLTREDSLGRENVRVAHSLDAALAIAETLPGEIYVCGGQRIFEEALALDRPLRLHLTLVHANVEGDRYFPEWRQLTWRETARRDGADANHRYTFLTLDRVQ